MNNAKEIAMATQQYFAIMKLPHDELAKSFLADCKSASVKIKSSQYDYYVCGEGPTVLLVHGLHSSLTSMVPMAQDLLQQGYKVVLFDAPAHGEAKGMSANLPQIKQMIQEVAKQLGELHAIVAHSLGSMWALSCWSDEFKAKGLVSVSGPSNPRFLVEKFALMNQLSEAVTQGLFQQLERRFGEDFWQAYSPMEIVKSMDVPGLVVHYQNDEFVPLSHAHQINDNWSGSQLEVLEGDEHFDSIKVPQVRDIICNYVKEL